jgi:hypothetical protein
MGAGVTDTNLRLTDTAVGLMNKGRQLNEGM